jgi:hypothetical protein
MAVLITAEVRGQTEQGYDGMLQELHSIVTAVAAASGSRP